MRALGSKATLPTALQCSTAETVRERAQKVYCSVMCTLMASCFGVAVLLALTNVLQWRLADWTVCVEKH